MDAIRSLYDYYRYTPFFLALLESRELFYEILAKLRGDENPQVRRWFVYFDANWRRNMFRRFDLRLDRFLWRAERVAPPDHPDAERINAIAEESNIEAERMMLMSNNDEDAPPPPVEVERPALLALIDRLLDMLEPKITPAERMPRFDRKKKPEPEVLGPHDIPRRKLPHTNWCDAWGPDPARREPSPVRAPAFPRDTLIALLEQKRHRLEKQPADARWDPFHRRQDEAERELKAIDIEMGLVGPTPELVEAYNQAHIKVYGRPYQREPLPEYLRRPPPDGAGDPQKKRAEGPPPHERSP